MCFGKNTENEIYFFNNTKMKNCSDKKILRATIDNNLKFKSHVKNLCKKPLQKMCGLCHI